MHMRNVRSVPQSQAPHVPPRSGLSIIARPPAGSEPNLPQLTSSAGRVVLVVAGVALIAAGLWFAVRTPLAVFRALLAVLPACIALLLGMAACVAGVWRRSHPSVVENVFPEGGVITQSQRPGPATPTVLPMQGTVRWLDRNVAPSTAGFFNDIHPDRGFGPGSSLKGISFSGVLSPDTSATVQLMCTAPRHIDHVRAWCSARPQVTRAILARRGAAEWLLLLQVDNTEPDGGLGDGAADLSIELHQLGPEFPVSVLTLPAGQPEASVGAFADPLSAVTVYPESEPDGGACGVLTVTPQT